MRLPTRTLTTFSPFAVNPTAMALPGRQHREAGARERPRQFIGRDFRSYLHGSMFGLAIQRTSLLLSRS